MSRLLRRRLLAGGAIALCALLFLGALAYRPGNPVNDLVRRYEGYSLIVVNPVQTVHAKPGEVKQVAFLLRNAADDDVTIYGMRAGCGCIRSDELPFRVKSGESRELHFDIHSAGYEPGARATNDVRLYLDVPSPPVLLTVSLCVDPPPDVAATEEPTAVASSL